MEYHVPRPDLRELHAALDNYIAVRAVMLHLSELLELGQDPMSNTVIREPYEAARLQWRAAAIRLKEAAARVADATIDEIDDDLEDLRR